LGLTPAQALFRSTAGFCNSRVGAKSIYYGVLHRALQRLFRDAMFADLFTDVGAAQCAADARGGGDGAAAHRGLLGPGGGGPVCFDARWKYAAGGLGFGHPGFVHTVW